MNCDDSNVLPLGQKLNNKTGRWHHVNYFPVENYFVGSGNKNLFAVNNALKQLEDAEVKETDVCSPLLLPSLLNVTVETAKGGTQTEPMVQWGQDCADVEDYDGVCFMMVKRMDDFICLLSTGHAALCGMQLELIERNNHYQVTHVVGRSSSSKTRTRLNQPSFPREGRFPGHNLESIWNSSREQSWRGSTLHNWKACS
jgi:hypothetical protein